MKVIDPNLTSAQVRIWLVGSYEDGLTGLQFHIVQEDGRQNANVIVVLFIETQDQIISR